MRRITWLIVISLLSLSLCLGQDFRLIESPTLDLQTALKLALENNPLVEQSLADLGLSGLKVDEAYLSLNPTLDVSAAVLAVRQTGSLGRPQRFFEEDLEATFTLPLYTFGQVYWSAQSAKLARNQSSEDLRTTVENLLQTVQTSFVTASLNEQLVSITKLQVSDRETYKKQATDLFDAGEIAEFEIIQADANVLSAQESLATTQQNAATARAELLFYLGVRPDTEVELASLPENVAPPSSIEEGMSRALKLRPEVVSLRWQLDSQLALAKANRRSNAPTLSLYGEMDSLNEGTSYTPTIEAGLQLTWKLFDGGAAKNAEAQALQMAERIRQQLKQEERQVALDATKAYLEMKTLWPQIDMARRSMDKATETLDIAKLRFEAGLSSGVELLSAQDGLSNARTALAQAEANYQLAQINWRKAISADYPVDPPASLSEKLPQAEPQQKETE